MPIRHAEAMNLPNIMAICDASIAGRMATSDPAPMTGTDRQTRFGEYTPGRRALWVYCNVAKFAACGPFPGVANLGVIRRDLGRTL